MLNIFLALSLTLGMASAKDGYYEHALPLLTLSEASISREQYAEYWFYRAVCHHQLMQKSEALKALKNLSDSFDPLPKRYLNVALMMKYDIDSWESTGLNDIERRMNGVSRRLALGMGGEETQRQQKKIIDRLNELIKEQEAKASGQLAKGCPSGGEKPGKPNPNDNVRPESAAPESIIMGGRGENKITVDAETLRKYADKWGTMPAAERAKVVKELTAQLPVRYEEMIKNYFQALEKGLPGAKR